nr:hypothetical protein JVH1_8844 [Rhodococcus sp. JVH1]
MRIHPHLRVMHGASPDVRVMHRASPEGSSEEFAKVPVQ